MSERVDKLERDVQKLLRLGWVTAACSVVSLVLKFLPGHTGSSPPAPAQQGANSNSVTIGATGPDAEPESRRVYLTTADIAEREKMAERTVVKYINEGRIQPAPVRSSKGWQIAAEYRILPQSAE